MDAPPVTPVSPQPNQSPQPEVVAAYVPVPPGQIPQAPGQAKGGTPWFVWLLASCGGCVVLLVVLGIIVIVAINPAKRLGEAEEASFKLQITDISNSITDCINGEKSKGTDPSKVYSHEGCADKVFLSENKYSTKPTLETTILLSDSAKTKICAYTAYTKPGDQKESVISWDSVSQTVSTSGRKTCT